MHCIWSFSLFLLGSAPRHLPFHVLRSGEHQLALLISYYNRIHRLSREGVPLDPCQNKPRLKHTWSPDVCPSAARPCPYVWQPVVNPHPSPALCLFRKIEQAQTQRRSSEPAAAHIQGVDPPFPVCAAENSPAHARLTHPHFISKHILQITKCPVTRTVSRTVGPNPRFKKPKLGEKTMEVG